MTAYQKRRWQWLTERKERLNADQSKELAFLERVRKMQTGPPHDKALHGPQENK